MSNVRPLASSFALALIAILSAPAAALAMESFAFDNVRIDGGAGKTSLLLKRIEFADTNLTREEIGKLFATGVEPREQTAIVAKMQARRVYAPEMELTPKGDRTGSVVIRGYEIVGLDKGRFTKASIAGFDGTMTDKDASGTIKSGPILLEDGDFARLIDAVRTSDFSSGVARLAKFSWTGFELSFADPKTPATAAGGNQMRFSMASLTGANTYQGDIPVRVQADMKGFSFTPPPASDTGKTLAAFGYDKIDLGLTLAGAYDTAKKAFTLGDYTITGANAGALTMTGSFGNIEPAALTGDRIARLGSIMQANVAEFSLRFVNAGLFDKAVAYYAANAGRSAESVRAEWVTAATGMLPMLLGGDPAGLQLAQAVGAFIRDPKNISIRLKAKDGALPFAQAAQIRDPKTFLQKVDVTALANQ